MPNSNSIILVCLDLMDLNIEKEHILKQLDFYFVRQAIVDLNMKSFHLDFVK